MLNSIRQRGLLLLALGTALAGCGGSGDDTSPAPVATPMAATFVGSETCSDCHAGEYERWTGSHHAKAMMLATDETVLGDFGNSEFAAHGVTTQFYRSGDEFRVRTDGADGTLQDFRIGYTFGITPLQQYLVEFPDGRIQALSIVWDTRPASLGGQRWYHLYPDEHIAHDDALHWTGLQQNWNYMCAECHSTNLQRNYDLAADRFETLWSEINVGCEGCHGPGSEHVARAEAATLEQGSGLLANLDDRQGAVWQMNRHIGIAERSILPMRPSVQPEACGRCHSRRAPVAAAYEYGKTLLDTHLPTLLDEELYFADGQILDEVYVYGSFLQSRMYRAGVTCSDCHDPHSAALKTSGTASSICASCHLVSTFSTMEHQRHSNDIVECVDCHMASRTYMGVDARRDHSFRVPRPDLTSTTGSPNACNACHADKDAQWAEAAIREWFGDRPRPHFAEAIHAGRTGTPGANRMLLGVIGDDTVPGIARATAMTLLAAPYGETEQRAVQRMTTSADAVLRLAAARAAGEFPLAARVQLAGPLLADPVLAVRIEAMRTLTTLRDELPPQQRAILLQVEREYVDSQLAITDRPEALANLANLARDAGNPGKAEDYYRLALSREPAGVVARVNLADSYAQQERHAEAEQLLREGLAIDTGNAALHHALGLALARTQRYDEALAELQAAVSLDADNSRFVYVYAIALNSLERSDEALSVLIEARDRFPGDFDIAWTLVTMSRDRGRIDEAKREAARLRALFPQNPDVRMLLQSLDGGN